MLMFFGKREPKKVSQDMLDGLLAESFERKIGQLAPKAERIARELERSRLEFIEACERLEELQAEPYTEDLYFANVASIKSQKVAYSRVIKRIADEMDLSAGAGETSYERYRKVLANVDHATAEMLKANASFRTVMYSYSNHMGAFKRSFAGMERSREELRREINARSREADEYTKAKEGIANLRLHSRELETLRESVDALKDDLGNAGKKELESDEKRIQKDLEGKVAELRGIESQVSRTAERISLFTAPLGRTARKQDHLSLKKVRLSSFIEDPIGRIDSDEEYAEFISSVREMRENVEKGLIDSKNKESLLDSISLLLESDLYNVIKSLKDTKARKAAVEDEIRTLERTLNDLRKGRDGIERAAKDVTAMEEREEAEERAIGSAKALVEGLFLEHYRRPISIVL